MKTNLKSKALFTNTLQWFGIVLSYLFSMILFSVLIPFPENLMKLMPPSGIVPPPFDLLINAIVNGTLIFWVAKRSNYRSFQLIIQLALCLFGVQTFQTQIETGYFISAFPLLKGTFEVYKIIFRGLLSSILFATLVTIITGGFKKRVKALRNFSFPAERCIKIAACLGVVYFVLYFIFGYYIAFQSQTLRSFYGVTGQLPSFFETMKNSFLEKPEIPFFQYCRGVLWIICLYPIMKGFTGKKTELIILSGLFFALIPTVQLLFPNPLMPAGVAVYHFFEVAISTGIFGAATAWLIPVKVK